MIPVTLEQIAGLAPNAKGICLDAFVNAEEPLVRFDITTPLRVAHLVGQLMHESGALTLISENLNYSARRLTEVWPSRFPTIKDAVPYERNPQKLGDKVYGGRMGNTTPGDGWKYRGRGLIQITGRNNYQRFGKMLGINLVEHPDLAVDPKYSLALAAAFFRDRGCNAWADADDIENVTRRINGGTIGLRDRQHWLDRAKAIWCAKPPDPKCSGVK